MRARGGAEPADVAPAAAPPLSVRDLALTALAKAAIGASVLAAGFEAVSDDDYARVVIAEEWARAPRFDASGTSWLPLPFWVVGAAMRVFGRGLGTARFVSVLLGS